jgi:hypothetical protein
VSLNEEAERQQLALEYKRAVLEGQIAALRAEFSAEEATITRIFRQDRLREASLASDKVEMGRSRQLGSDKSSGNIPRNIIRKTVVKTLPAFRKAKGAAARSWSGIWGFMSPGPLLNRSTPFAISRPSARSTWPAITESRPLIY